MVQCHIEIFGIVQGSTEFLGVVQCRTGIYGIVQGHNELYRVAQSRTEFTEWYRIVHKYTE